MLGKRIPTIFGILILLVGMAVGVWIVSGRSVSLITKAGPTAVPKNVKVVNKGPSSFTVTWTTDNPISGLIRYAQDPTKIKTPAGDMRDQLSGSTGDSTTHYVDVTNLASDKIYYFVIVSGSGEYNDNGNPYQVKTTAVGKGEEDIVYGKVVTAANQIVPGAIVYAEMDGSDTLAALTGTDGGWRINLGNARNPQGQLLTYDKQKQRLTLFVQGGSVGTATALTTLAQARPVNNIVLGQAQNFMADANNPPTLGGTGGQGGSFNNINGSAAVAGVNLINPQVEHETIATTRPELRGIAPSGTQITITIHSDQVLTGQVVADANGNWTWTPPQNLTPGEHSVVLQFKDASGILQTITRSFVVLAAENGGGLPAFTSTPSAYPTTATISGSLGDSTMPSTESGVPNTGSLTPTLILLIVGVGLYISGLIWKQRIAAEYGR